MSTEYLQYNTFALTFLTVYKLQISSYWETEAIQDY